MSLERARKTINLQKTDKTAQWEFISNVNFLNDLTGYDAGLETRKALIEAYGQLETDFINPLPQDINHTSKGIVGNTGTLIGQEPECIYEFDPFNLPDNDLMRDLVIDPKLSACERAETLQAYWKDSQDAIGNNAMVPGCNWDTLLHAFTKTFGYECTVYAAYTDVKRFKEAVERYALVSLKHMESLALTDAELILCHDDLGMSDRTIFSPDWYREFIFPWYRELWKPLKKAGKKVLFYSDGNINEIMEDIVETGIDGMFIDTCSSLEKAVEKFGGKIFLIGNADIVKISFGNETDIEQEIRRCLSSAKGLPGYILCASGQFLNDVPVENIKKYFQITKILR